MNPLQFRRHHQSPSYHEGLVREALYVVIPRPPSVFFAQGRVLAASNGNPAGHAVPAGLRADPGTNTEEGQAWVRPFNAGGGWHVPPVSVLPVPVGGR